MKKLILPCVFLAMVFTANAQNTTKNSSNAKNQGEMTKGGKTTMPDKAVKKNNTLSDGNSKGINEAGIKVVEDKDEARKKGWDGSVKGNSKSNESTTSSKNTVEHWGDPHENLNGKQAKGWDGSVKGNNKGIQEAGIKKYEGAPKNNVKDLKLQPKAKAAEVDQSIINTTKSNTKD